MYQNDTGVDSDVEADECTSICSVYYFLYCMVHGKVE